jgi:excisionase family DNA binding protein
MPVSTKKIQRRATPRPATPRQTRLMTLQQASNESGVPYMSVRHLVKQGHLPHVQLGDSRRIWIRRADFERVIETLATNS